MARSPISDRLNFMGAWKNIREHDPLDDLLLGLRKLPRWRTEWVTDREEGRPALMSWDVYGTPDLFRVIMDYNGLLSNLLFTAGTRIYLPSPRDLLDLYRRQSSNLASLSRPPTSDNPFLNLSEAGRAAMRREITV